MNKFIENLNWRYATKEFDTSKKVSRGDLDEIIEVFRLSASGFGLQPWKLFVIEDEDLKKQIMGAAWNQKQVGENSYLLVFAKNLNVDKNLVDKYLDRSAELNGISRYDLSGYEQTLLGFVDSTPREYLQIFSENQVYLSLGNVLAFLADKKIDSCPVGGFDNEKVDAILSLRDKGFASVILLPIGYRSENDTNLKRKKVRFEKEDIFEIM
ncbi:hypothetical protein BKN14_02875 [Candidatus Gracilibacteria bacterium HOT-871]|nr:hypothetical protein BKN14_02875 [Candidatus Gracilibacteria bacterium HOT-871]